jgi:hypothetical protein
MRMVCRLPACLQGDFSNIHPPDKQIPGSRLAKQALEMIYKKTGLNSAFPIYAGAKLSIAQASVSQLVATNGCGPICRPSGHCTIVPCL